MKLQFENITDNKADWFYNDVEVMHQKDLSRYYAYIKDGAIFMRNKDREPFLFLPGEPYTMRIKGGEVYVNGIQIGTTLYDTYAALLPYIGQAGGGSGSGSGGANYDALVNRPQINGNTLTGDKSSSDLGLQSELTFDDEPESGSDNPVTSDGIYHFVTEITGDPSDLDTDDADNLVAAINELKAESDAQQSEIDGMRNLGHYLLTVDNKATAQTAGNTVLPTFDTQITGGVHVSINDYANVRADETHSGLTTRYIITNLIQLDDVDSRLITWTYDITYSTDITGKADKKVPATVNNVAVLDSTGNLADGGETITQIKGASIPKVNPATAGNVPLLKSDGTLETSTITGSDVQLKSNIIALATEPSFATSVYTTYPSTKSIITWMNKRTSKRLYILTTSAGSQYVSLPIGNGAPHNRWCIRVIALSSTNRYHIMSERDITVFGNTVSESVKYKIGIGPGFYTIENVTEGRTDSAVYLSIGAAIPTNSIVLIERNVSSTLEDLGDYSVAPALANALPADYTPISSVFRNSLLPDGIYGCYQYSYSGVPDGPQNTNLYWFKILDIVDEPLLNFSNVAPGTLCWEVRIPITASTISSQTADINITKLSGTIVLRPLSSNRVHVDFEGLASNVAFGAKFTTTDSAHSSLELYMKAAPKVPFEPLILRAGAPRIYNAYGESAVKYAEFASKDNVQLGVLDTNITDDYFDNKDESVYWSNGLTVVVDGAIDRFKLVNAGTLGEFAEDVQSDANNAAIVSTTSHPIPLKDALTALGKRVNYDAIGVIKTLNNAKTATQLFTFNAGITNYETQLDLGVGGAFVKGWAYLKDNNATAINISQMPDEAILVKNHFNTGVTGNLVDSVVVPRIENNIAWLSRAFTVQRSVTTAPVTVVALPPFSNIEADVSSSILLGSESALLSSVTDDILLQVEGIIVQHGTDITIGIKQKGKRWYLNSISLYAFKSMSNSLVFMVNQPNFMGNVQVPGTIIGILTATFYSQVSGNVFYQTRQFEVRYSNPPTAVDVPLAGQCIAVSETNPVFLSYRSLM